MAELKELKEYRRFARPVEQSKAIAVLAGILEGVAMDGVVCQKEYDEVENWYALHRNFLNKEPLTEIRTVMDKALEDGILTAEEAQDIRWLCQKCLDDGLYFDQSTVYLQELHGILQGILSDGELHDKELEKLAQWLTDADFLANTYPYAEIYSLLTAAKEDGVITADEKNMLKAFFSVFVDTKNSFNIHQQTMAELKKQYSIGGICAICPDIVVEGNTFCFTGMSTKVTRKEIAQIVQDNGGIFNNNVVKATKYLIVGADGNPCWAYSCYGRKVEQATQRRKDGQDIVLVHEYDFWDAIEDLK